MKNIYLLSVLLLLIVVSCEDVEVAYPGNNQTTSPVSPVGTAEWLGGFSGELPENTAPGVSIATLNAEDGNPDDEFSTESSYTIASQKIDGINVDYFTIETGEDGVSKLVTNRSIDYESLSGSKTVDLSITVEDD
ncbi:cadherin repeat domain-containing protein, partial [Candidatus Marinimicrobia bacterium]|nr:cadherin repeat domain-containing protein [Candidatus Neomarinimicrobiota bacterium]